MRPKLHKRSALKLVGRIIPGAKHRGKNESRRVGMKFEALVVVRLSENEHSEV